MAHIHTVRGPLDTAQLGVTLMREHVFVLSKVMRHYPLARNPGGKVLKARLRRSVDWGSLVG
jgi:predicted metal-dependent phosphotriesterase family hydrolase